MRILVTELPGSPAECGFSTLLKDDPYNMGRMCTLNKMFCNVKECTCLAKITDIVQEA
jgi:hypothetical protein